MNNNLQVVLCYQNLPKKDIIKDFRFFFLKIHLDIQYSLEINIQSFTFYKYSNELLMEIHVDGRGKQYLEQFSQFASYKIFLK